MNTLLYFVILGLWKAGLGDFDLICNDWERGILPSHRDEMGRSECPIKARYF